MALLTTMPPSLDRGGGVYLYGNSVLRNSILDRNAAVSNGGGAALITSGSTLQNCTLVSNRAASGGGVLCEDGGNVQNSIAYFNTATNFPEFLPHAHQPAARRDRVLHERSAVCAHLGKSLRTQRTLALRQSRRVSRLDVRRVRPAGHDAARGWRARCRRVGAHSAGPRHHQPEQLPASPACISSRIYSNNPEPDDSRSGLRGACR
jgi:hypothetical protein